MPVKLIASDMDGTLLMDDHVTISERNLRAIREAIRRGIHFVPASGRMLTFLPQALGRHTGNPLRHYLKRRGGLRSAKERASIPYTDSKI